MIEEVENTKGTLTEISLAYISGAYRSRWGWLGILFHILLARRVGQKYFDKGYMVIIPHSNSAFMRGRPELWIDGCLAIIGRLRRKSDCLVMLHNWEASQGAQREYKLAKKRRIRIIYET